MSEKLTDLVLERYLLGEYSPLRMKAIRKCLTTEDRRRLEALKRDNEVFFRTHSRSLFRKALSARLDEDLRTGTATQRRVRLDRKPVIGKGAAAFTAAALLAVILLAPNWRSVPAESRIKGRGTPLVLYLKQGSDFRPLEEGEILHAGDCVQLSYLKGEFAFAAIVSIDGNGIVTRHFPLAGENAMESGDEDRILLPNSFTFDNAPDFEKFYLFRSQTEFSLDTVYTYLRNPDAGEDHEIAAITVTEFVVYKATSDNKGE